MKFALAAKDGQDWLVRLRITNGRYLIVMKSMGRFKLIENITARPKVEKHIKI